MQSIIICSKISFIESCFSQFDKFLFIVMPSFGKIRFFTWAKVHLTVFLPLSLLVMCREFYVLILQFPCPAISNLPTLCQVVVLFWFVFNTCVLPDNKSCILLNLNGRYSYESGKLIVCFVTDVSLLVMLTSVPLVLYIFVSSCSMYILLVSIDFAHWCWKRPIKMDS